MNTWMFVRGINMKQRTIRKIVEKSYPMVGISGRGLTALDTHNKQKKRKYWRKMTRRELDFVRPYVLMERKRRQEYFNKVWQEDVFDDSTWGGSIVRTEGQELEDVKKLERKMIDGSINN